MELEAYIVKSSKHFLNRCVHLFTFVPAKLVSFRGMNMPKYSCIKSNGLGKNVYSFVSWYFNLMANSFGKKTVDQLASWTNKLMLFFQNSLKFKKVYLYLYGLL